MEFNIEILFQRSVHITWEATTEFINLDNKRIDKRIDFYKT